MIALRKCFRWLATWVLPIISTLFPGVARATNSTTPQWDTTVAIEQQGGWGSQFQPDVSKLRAIGYSRWDWRSWVTAADVPHDLQSRALDTSTYLEVDVDETGRVSNCIVLKPSSDARLDQIACRRIVQAGKFDVVYSAPGIRAAQRINIAVTWKTVPHVDPELRTQSLPIAAPPAPPLPSGWPRMAWRSGLGIVQFPDLQSFYPVHDHGTGKTSIELTIAPDTGTTKCDVGVGSGDQGLDNAACVVAMKLPLRYDEPCTVCVRTLPLQFVWLRHGSYIRVPLPTKGTYHPKFIKRDPADPTPQAQTEPSRHIISVGPLVNAKDIAASSASNFRPSLWLTIDETGKVTNCSINRSTGDLTLDARICGVMGKTTYSVITDIFGDPVPNRMIQYVNLSR